MFGRSIKSLPEKITFVDVETTGLHSTDRIVSLGMITLNGKAAVAGKIEVDLEHLIFDPGKKSHPRAEAVHGYSDWTLRHQQPFDDEAGRLILKMNRSELLVAHNANFDRGFIEREFLLAGLATPIPQYYCTMSAYRQNHSGRANLNAILAEMGLQRRGATHGALEDAWMGMLVYLWLNGMDVRQPPPASAIAPSNYREPPPQPEGALPRRRKKPAPVGPIVETRTTSMSQTQRNQILGAAAPTATMMMAVATADGDYSDGEASALTSLVAYTIGHLGLPYDLDGEQDIVATLAELDTSDYALEIAARTIVNDQTARENLSRWVREVTYSDGEGTMSELRAIERITAALGRARRS